MIVLVPEGVGSLQGLEILSNGWGEDVNDELKTTLLGQQLPCDYDDMWYACVDLHTNKGLIQVISYNIHNGYYPHHVYVEWDGYTDYQLL